MPLATLLCGMKAHLCLQWSVQNGKTTIIITTKMYNKTAKNKPTKLNHNSKCNSQLFEVRPSEACSARTHRKYVMRTSTFLSCKCLGVWPRVRVDKTHGKAALPMFFKTCNAHICLHGLHVPLSVCQLGWLVDCLLSMFKHSCCLPRVVLLLIAWLAACQWLVVALG